MTLLILIALILSYEGVKNIKTNIVARMECHEGAVSLILENNGAPCKIYYLTVTEGDKIIMVLELNQILNTEKRTLELDILDIQRDKLRVSMVFDRGVIGGLTCGSSVRSQP
ncbi:MAG: hypothetical protein NZ992_05125 [Candidatus Korarchaeum sp.]|nr:hypothetical protein [Candidatus Korarchaeum sp.]MDW8035533.1 hypothetical protein [Candidatus Korarchaeum sp.]